jgi:hypothetical protein
VCEQGGLHNRLLKNSILLIVLGFRGALARLFSAKSKNFCFHFGGQKTPEPPTGCFFSTLLNHSLLVPFIPAMNLCHMPTTDAEFEAHLDQTGLDKVLIFRHYARLGVALAGCLAVVVFSCVHQPAQHDLGLVRKLLILFSNFSIGISVMAMVFSQRMGKSLRRQASNVSERSRQIFRYLTGRGWMFFCVAGFGQAVFISGVLYGINVYTWRDWFLAANLVPTILMVMIEWAEIPTRPRIIGLYRAVALLQSQQKKPA